MSIQSSFNYSSGQFVTVTGNAATVALAGGTGGILLLTNVSGNLLFVQVGGSTVTASNTSIPISPNGQIYLVNGTGGFLSSFTLGGGQAGLNICFGS